MRSKNVLITVILTALAITGLSKVAKFFAQVPSRIDNAPPPNATCYAVAPVPDPGFELDQLMQQLEWLDEQFQHQQINEETYKERREQLVKRIKELERQMNGPIDVH